MPAPEAGRPIAVFDSGIGGLSVLRALHAALPAEDFIYFADTAHAPDGEQDDAYVAGRSLQIARTLLTEHRAKALVVACNTATAAAIEAIRTEFPATPVVGIEPALKPATALTRTGHVGVLATRSTLQSDRFQALRQSLEGRTRFTCLPGDGLAEAIEQATAGHDTTKMIALCEALMRTLGDFGSKPGDMDVLVLGCTHYAFAWQHLQRLAGLDVALLEPGAAVARRTANLLLRGGLLDPYKASGNTQYLSSGDVMALQQVAARWLAAG